MQTDRLTGQLSGGEGAGVGEAAVRLTLHLAFLLPRGKVTNVVQLRRLLHPLWGGNGNGNWLVSSMFYSKERNTVNKLK